jgi:hypothetical protein
MNARRAYLIREEVSRVTNHLASMPGLAHAAVETAVARSLLLESGGEMLLRGRTYDVVAKSLGAGVYRVTTREKGGTE